MDARPGKTSQWRGTDIAISDERAGVADPTAIAIDEIWNVPLGCELFPDAQYAPLDGLATGSREAQERQRELVNSMNLPLEIRTKAVGIRFRLIPAGTFIMGSPVTEQGRRHKVETQHKVTLTLPFYMGTFDITQGQWKKVMGSNPSYFKDAGDNAPVEHVLWHDCTDFMRKSVAMEGLPEGSFRLPTEAQWEYACRAGTQTAFCYGDDLDSSMTNFNGKYPYGKGKKGEYRETTVAVGSFKPNAWGLYDMHGNVWEWCADWYGAYGEDATDPSGAATGTGRVVRGGGWIDYANECRSAFRDAYLPDFTYIFGSGFRLSLPTGQQ